MKLFTYLMVAAALLVLPTQSFSQTIEFNNPIAEQRADPWVYKTDDGMYYLIDCHSSGI
jgi:hypothetical protein